MKILLFIAVIGIAVSAVKAQGPCVDTESSNAAIRAVRKQSQIDFPLRATPVPSLSDDVVFLKTRGRRAQGTTVPVVSFYAVTLQPYKVEGNIVTTETVQLDGNSEWLVAVTDNAEDTYLLLGSRNLDTAFNSFVRTLDLHVADASAALNVFEFFLKVARGDEFRSRVVSSDMKLESVALEDFRLRFSANKSRDAFDSWWKGVSRATKLAIRPPLARATENGFIVQYFLYDRSHVQTEKLEINTDGTIGRRVAEVSLGWPNVTPGAPR